MMSYGDPNWRPWQLGAQAALPIVRRAVEAGITFFDTADMYSNGASEEITGRILKELFSQRDEYVLATKVYFPLGPGANSRGLSRKHILHGIDSSLRRLGTDHVDIYQIHRWDYETPIEETMSALHQIVQAGKARYLGASSMFAWQFAKAQFTAREQRWTTFATMQNHYNLVYREEEREMIPFCRDQGVGIIPWSPLARGLLAGNRDRGGARLTTRAQSDELADTLYEEHDLVIADAARAVAGERGVPIARVALAWLLGRSGVSAPIVGATRPEHIDDAVASVGLSLSAEERSRLEAPYRPRAVSGHS
jgi:aryl-alcohol dehydrogenase-like predicted oxidoreductase